MSGLLFSIALLLDTLSPTNQAAARPVVEHPTFHREYAARRFVGRIEHFEYLLDNMHVCSVWSEQTGLIDYRAVLLPDGRLYAENKEKANGWLELVGCDAGQRLFYMEGTQRGLFTAKGRGVILVKYKQISATEVEYSGKLWVRIDNGVVAGLAKLFFVFVKGAVDRNFELVIRQPVDLTSIAWYWPETLRELHRHLPKIGRAHV